MTDHSLRRLTPAEIAARAPAFGGMGSNLEWRRCGTPSDGYGRGIVVRFADAPDWYALEGSIIEQPNGRWTWADGSEIDRP